MPVITGPLSRMAAKVDKFLQPGEKVVCRAKFDPDAVMNLLVGHAFLQAVSGFAVGWIAFSSSKAAPLYGLAGAVCASLGILAIGAWVLHQFRFRVAITDRRLLVLESRLGPQPTEVALSEVARVHGTSNGNSLPIQIETRDGRLVTLFDEFWDRGFGLLIAEASGLAAVPDGQTAAERIAGLLYRSDRFGLLGGAVLSAVGAMLVLSTFGPALADFGKPFALVAIALTVVVLLWIGSKIGRVAFPAFTVLCLRPRYGADEMRDAFRLLAHRRLLPREKDECRRLQPLIWWVAGLLYRRRFDPIGADGLNPQA